MDMHVYYAQLTGSLITGFRMEEDAFGDEPWPTFTIETEAGEQLQLVLSRDPEGNGGGFGFIEPAADPEVTR